MSERRGRLLNRAELAEFFGKSLPTIDVWVKAGCPFVERGDKGRKWVFNSADVAEWRERRAAAAVEVKAPVGDLDPAQERARKDRALAIQTEMRNDLMQGEVVRIDDVMEPLERQHHAVREHFLALPVRVASRVPREVMTLVETTTRDLLYEAMEEFSAQAIVDEVQRPKHKRRGR